MTQEEFNAKYWAAQPPEVRALAAMPRTSEEEIRARIDAADDLARKGFIIDADIHGYGYDPYTNMVRMRDHGYTWYPARFQTPNYDQAPGVSMPSGVVGWPNRPYNPHAPMPGSIKVSLDPADYPPFDSAPAPPPPVPQGVPGAFTGPKTRGLLVGDNSPAGVKWTDRVTGQVWVKRWYANPFGGSVQWELVGE